MIEFAREEDLPEILAVYAPYVLGSTATFEYVPPSLPEFTERFRDITAQFPWLVFREEGRILGYAYASHPYTRPAYAWCAEPSVYLVPEARGRGIGRALYAALEALLLAQGYQVLYALITEENTASLTTGQKHGDAAFLLKIHGHSSLYRNREKRIG